MLDLGLLDAGTCMAFPVGCIRAFVTAATSDEFSGLGPAPAAPAAAGPAAEGAAAVENRSDAIVDVERHLASLRMGLIRLCLLDCETLKELAGTLRSRKR